LKQTARRNLQISLFILLIVIFNFVYATVIFAVNGPQVLNGDGDNLNVQKIVDGLDRPSGFEFIGNGDILVTERDSAQVRLIRNFDIKKYPVIDLNHGSMDLGHLAGIAYDPIDSNKFIFLAYVWNASKFDSKGSDVSSIQIFRYVWNSTGMKLEHPLLVATSPLPPNLIIGDVIGKILVGPDHKIYILNSNPDQNTSFQNSRANDRDNIHRTIDHCTEDFNSPSCTPICSSVAVTKMDEVGKNLNNDTYPLSSYTCDVASVVGLAFDPVTGYLWGVSGRENEVEIIEPSSKKGCALVDDNATYCALQLDVLSNLTQVTGLIFARQGIITDNDSDGLFVSDSEGDIYRFQLDKMRENLVGQQKFGTGFGSISDLKIGPDRALYVLSSDISAASPNDPSQGNSGSLYRIAKDRLPLPFYESTIKDADQIGLIGILTVVASSLVVITVYDRYRKRDQ
jgi:hypothetical protein